MLERFSDRARKVLDMANYEAQRFHHDAIGAEHLLLALTKENTGMAATVLRCLGADPEPLFMELERRLEPGPVRAHIDMRVVLPRSPAADRVIQHAIDEARALKFDYVGTEHLLLGLLHEKEGVAAQLLGDCCLILQPVRRELLDLVATLADQLARRAWGHLPRSYPMKILEWKAGEIFRIGNTDVIEVTVLEACEDRVRLLIQTPPGWVIGTKGKPAAEPPTQ